MSAQANKKATEIRAKNADELKTLSEELRVELFKARIQNHTNQLDSTAKLRDLKRNLARINTVLRQRELETATDGSPGASAGSTDVKAKS